jgi:hypothetical protein
MTFRTDFPIVAEVGFMKLSDIPEPIRYRMLIDEWIYGNAFCLKKEDGTFERIDPMTVKLNPKTKKFDIFEEEQVKP